MKDSKRKRNKDSTNTKENSSFNKGKKNVQKKGSLYQ